MIAQVDNVNVQRRKDTAVVCMEYPRSGPIDKVEIEHMEVRTADSIRVSYDFERDGWKIEQAQIFEWNADDNVCDPEWVEVHFVQAWAKLIPGGRDPS